MIEFKTELDLNDIESEWKMLCTDNNHIWYKLKGNRFLPKGKYMEPHSYDLLAYLKGTLNYEYLVPSVNLFKNSNRLSTQIPMKHIYYTECEELTEWNAHLGYVEVRYFEHSWELEQLQKLVKELI